ncbi:hypothetical protein LPJ61_004692 [Coemansia biformis]|uniref:NAD(P)-binding protein n=1 Tax=Coemansia biformis TaxID=1286918 RepID=A0A9W8CXC3_9FUNG|nr:hypothetical protein LPJ61_004692 [Coemansia biformis]
MAESQATTALPDTPGYLGLKVISRWAARGSDATGRAGGGRWEETQDVVEFEQARVVGGSDGAEWFEALSARIDRGQHTLVVGGGQQRRAALGAVLLAPNGGGLLVGGVMRSPRPHRGIAHVVGGRKPYMRSGSSLWDLLVFPHDKSQSLRRGVEERHLAELLRRLEFGFLLGHVGDDWGKVIDWAKVLDRRGSTALAVCRLLYHAPEFALVDDDALRNLLPDQVRRVFGVANMHHVTMVVLAETDPFDDTTPLSPPASSSSSSSLVSPSGSTLCKGDIGFFACIGEFSRALRLRGSRVWEFCSFGYGSGQRAAFDTTMERQWVWSDGADGDGTVFRSSLRRKPSTLSQCTTTERHWLAASECPLSPTAVDCSGSLSRRQSALLASPALTAHSSLSDFTMATSELGSIRSRPINIDAMLSPLRQPSPPAVVEPISEQSEDVGEHGDTLCDGEPSAVSEKVPSEVADVVTSEVASVVPSEVADVASNAASSPAPGAAPGDLLDRTLDEFSEAPSRELPCEPPVVHPVSKPTKVAATRGGPRVITEEELEAERPGTPASPRPRNYRRSTRVKMWMPVADPVMQEVQSGSRRCAAIVTGASKGLGREITLELLRRRVSVIAVARSADNLEAMRNDALTAACGRAQYIPCPADITTEQGLWRVEACLAQSGFVLITLINNAGTLEPVAPIAGSSLENWRKHFDLNMFAPVELSRRLLPTLRITKGRIINISSGAASHPYYGWAAYCASKAALDMLTMSLGTEEPEVVTLAIRPGVIDTDMQKFIREKGKDTMRPNEYERFAKLHEDGKLLDPSIPAYIIARVALEASRDMSGKTYSWDDTQLARFRSHQDVAFSPIVGHTTSAPGETILPPEFLFAPY